LTVTFTSLLFVPGHRPERVAKALTSSAGIVCIDLEDAVPDDAKQRARAAVVETTKINDGQRIAVRINRVTNRAGLADLLALEEAPPATLLVPMVEHPAELAVARGALGERVALIPLVETVAGLRAAAAIAGAPGVTAIMFGGGDLSAQLGVALEWEPLLVARSQLIMAAGEVGVPAIDVPFVRLGDPAGLADECSRARALGFSAKAAIHPDQLDAIHRFFTATEAERDDARAALAAWRAGGGGAVRWKGRLLEASLIERLRDFAGETTDA
jgi:(S)-citramalyl-CoA lyase